MFGEAGSQPREPLAPEEVRVHLVDASGADPRRLAETCLGWLPEDERQRYERYLPPQARHEFLVTRVLCRTVLGKHLDTPPESLRFAVGAYGKPELLPLPFRPPLRFNLSNTSGLVACAVSRAWDLGVDVEWMLRRAETLAVAERFFSRREAAALFALPLQARPQRFFELWTLKEAYIKARGLGLAIPLGDFSFALDGDPVPGIAFEPSLADDPDAWWFEQMFPSEAHALALAVRSEGARPRTSIVWERALTI